MATGVLIPPGKITFLDNNGVPLAGGKVYFYAPSTTNFKNTWQDSGLTVLNANPVVLDSAGRAIVWGTGLYRQLVNDSLGNTIWDQVAGMSLPTGQLLGRQIFSTHGTSTYTPTAGTTQVFVQVVGAGGAGGGTVITGASQISAGGGGGAGGYAEKLITSAFSGVTVTVGTGGVGVAAANGGAGGTSSFGSLVSATGGNGGIEGTLSATGGIVGGVAGGTGIAGDINSGGGGGGGTFYINAALAAGGAGGNSFFEGGASSLLTSTGVDGNPATGAGGGGGGAGAVQNQGSTFPGGDGADGIVVVWEYT